MNQLITWKWHDIWNSAADSSKWYLIEFWKKAESTTFSRTRLAPHGEERGLSSVKRSRWQFRMAWSSSRKKAYQIVHFIAALLAPHGGKRGLISYGTTIWNSVASLDHAPFRCPPLLLRRVDVDRRLGPVSSHRTDSPEVRRYKKSSHTSTQLRYFLYEFSSWAYHRPASVKTDDQVFDSSCMTY